jgi:hypothetical protein
MWFLAIPFGTFMIAASAEEIAFLYVGEPDSAADFGARQGLSEATAQGEFLGIRYQLVRSAEPASAPRAVIAAVSPQKLRELANQYPELPILNVTATDTALREECRDNVFHVIPSRAMLSDAEAQWRSVHPESLATAHTWHRDFRKYAASQLNIRFREQFERDMNDAAWAGWAAVKLLSDTIARQPQLGGQQLMDELKTNLAFDGQKGVDMRFRETGQLRQPLLLIEDDKIVGEAPVRGVVDVSNLDSLGVSFCPK